MVHSMDTGLRNWSFLRLIDQLFLHIMTDWLAFLLIKGGRFICSNSIGNTVSELYLWAYCSSSLCRGRGAVFHLTMCKWLFRASTACGICSECIRNVSFLKHNNSKSDWLIIWIDCLTEKSDVLFHVWILTATLPSVFLQFCNLT